MPSSVRSRRRQHLLQRPPLYPVMLTAGFFEQKSVPVPGGPDTMSGEIPAQVLLASQVSSAVSDDLLDVSKGLVLDNAANAARGAEMQGER